MQRPVALRPLVFFLLFLSLGGLYGSISMLTDPASGSLQLTEILPLLPVSDYILPGISLLVVMGMAPLLLIGFKWSISYITAVDGFLIILFVLMPGLRRFYAKM